MRTEVFNENNLRRSIVGVWGPAGGHVIVYDEIIRRLRALEVENGQLRAGVNGTDWENDLLAHAPDHYDDDVAQTEIITRYVRDLEAVAAALRIVGDDIFDGHITPETPDEDHAEPYCFECDVPWPCARADLAKALGTLNGDWIMLDHLADQGHGQEQTTTERTDS